ncbi:hypothetical protein Tco_0690264, partial [Tanacetum coccineum]
MLGFALALVFFFFTGVLLCRHKAALCTCCESVENTNKSWPLDCLGAQGLKSKPLIELWELGLPPWTRPCGGWGLVMVMVLECCGEVNEVDIDRRWGYEVWRERFIEDKQCFKTRGFGHWQKHPPKVINVIASMVLVSYSFGGLAELALV